MVKNKKWYDYLWIYTPIYLILGMFNILFAWLGVIEMMVPLFISIFGGGKLFCHRYCGRGQMFDLLGNKWKLSRNKTPPMFLSSSWFRYGFLVFFMTMFILMIITTVNVFIGIQDVKQGITILWTFRTPWQFAYHGTILSPGVAQFAFGMYSIMLTSSILGFITMLVWKPRSWCVYCPMGTMTQAICKVKKVGMKDGNAS